MSMNARDRAFLTDVVQFTHKNHIAVVYILQSRLCSGELLEDVAVHAEQQFRHKTSREAVLAEVRKYNDANRVRQIVCARILAEYVSTCEDLGAFGDAIRYRKNDSIFERYLKSSPGQAASFFDKHVLPCDVLADSTITLRTLLDLPDIAALAGRMSQENSAALQQSYRNQAINLFAAAKTYREVGKGVKAMSNSGTLSSGLGDEVHIILDLKQIGSASTKKGGIFARALNKIKHRFTVTERLGDYAEPGAADEIEYAILRPQSIGQIVENTIAASGTMAELAAILVHLDSVGVPI
jgi:hypothetical protein